MGLKPTIKWLIIILYMLAWIYYDLSNNKYIRDILVYILLIEPIAFFFYLYYKVATEKNPKKMAHAQNKLKREIETMLRLSPLYFAAAIVFLLMLLLRLLMIF